VSDLAREMWHAPHYSRVCAGTLREHWVREPSYAERYAKQAVAKAREAQAPDSVSLVSDGGSKND
jgi:hypothetical protein